VSRSTEPFAEQRFVYKALLEHLELLLDYIKKEDALEVVENFYPVLDENETQESYGLGVFDENAEERNHATEAEEDKESDMFSSMIS
jgi:hypothetical protein